MKLDKNYKVRVKPKQSREIHFLILLEGGEVSYGLKPQLQDEFLVVENEHDSVVIYYTDQDIFPTIENQEIQADDLIALLTDLSKSAENPPQKMELTPEFEAVEPVLSDNCQVNTQDNSVNIQDTPKFKAGDKVYKSGDKVIVKKVSPDEVDNRINIGDTGTVINVCHPKEGAKLIQLELDNHPSRNFWWIDKNKVVLASETTSEQVLIDFDLERRIEEFSERMLRKLKHKSRQGYKGWETCKHGDLVQLLINHVDKGDPIDVANFCAFLFARGESLTEAVLDE